MEKESCAEGQKWDSLLRRCIVVPGAKTTTGPPVTTAVEQQLRSTPASMLVAGPPMGQSQVLWLSVVLAIVGSILALVLWFIIFRQQKRRSCTPVPGEDPLPNTEPPTKIHPEKNGQGEPLHIEPGAPPLCHLYVGAQTGSKREDGFTTCRGPEGGGVLQACSFPLPATELGGTALVTTKTV